MADSDKIKQLLNQIEDLSIKQELFSMELEQLREEVLNLQGGSATNIVVEKQEPVVPPIKQKIEEIPIIQPIKQKVVETPPIFANALPKAKSNIEKFIGENLISKIGIAITVLGVGVGAKYAIDHDLISPLTRIILGYLVGLGLLGFAIKLKKNYESFSAVLLSGAMAIMYFLTYAAYDFYGLILQAPTFVLMVLFTIFTVVAAIQYDKPVIAHIGLVGAYAVPMLLSNNSGKVEILFSYMAIINVGILVVAFKKYWKSLYYSAFVFTWLIFSIWYNQVVVTTANLQLAFFFASIFFLIFYVTFIVYKLIRKQQLVLIDVLLVLANSFVFFGIGLSILSLSTVGENFLGLFTLINAIIHFAVSFIIYQKKLADRNLFYLTSGLVLVFITIAVPIQLNGNWVTLLWAFEAALLFWIGRSQNILTYEKLSYILMGLAFFSLIQDWSIVYDLYLYNPASKQIPFLFNIHFLTSILFIAAFVFINFIHNKQQYMHAEMPLMRPVYNIMNYAIPSILLIVAYFSLWMEINFYWEQLYQASGIKLNKDIYNYTAHDEDLKSFQVIWLINYSLAFFAILSFINIYKVKNKELGLANLVFNIGAILAFLTQGLYALSELRDSYISQYLATYFEITSFNLIIRYISYIFVAILLTGTYQYIKQDFIKLKLQKAFDLLLSITLLWMLSSELIHWMDIYKSTQSYKLGLSILWGVYALVLVILGIWKSKKHLRIGAIVLFTITLVKLFLYDIAALSTIAKTIVFVSLGVLLLIISFLYNKYKAVIANENEK